VSNGFVNQDGDKIMWMVHGTMLNSEYFEVDEYSKAENLYLELRYNMREEDFLGLSLFKVPSDFAKDEEWVATTMSVGWEAE
jgi:hypothetical protein